VRIVAGGASALGEGTVLDGSLLPELDLLVASAADDLGRVDKELPMGAAVRLVAIDAKPVGHRFVYHWTGENLGQLAVTGRTQHGRTVSEQTRVASDVRIVAGIAVAGLGRRMGYCSIDLGVQVLMTGQTDVLLIDQSGLRCLCATRTEH
jgi:hypothetical protein